MMTVEEANAVNVLLDYLFKTKALLEEKPDEHDARFAAGVLAQGAYHRLRSGLTPKDVDELFSRVPAMDEAFTAAEKVAIVNKAQEWHRSV